MGMYSVPDSIRKMKPVGTMVKAIKGRYYVYEYKTVTDETGKRKTVMGKCIGSINEEKGFVPNANYICDAEMTSLEYGQYALALANSQKTLELLREFFCPDDALRIYCTALIGFLNGFPYLTEIGRYYEMSYLSLKYPGLKMEYTALSALCDELGRGHCGVLALERAFVGRSSRQMAIDARAIGGTRRSLLTAYDVNTGLPLFSGIYEGALSDTPGVRELLGGAGIRDMLFLIDRGLYSAPNLEYFSQNGSDYVISVPGSSGNAKRAAAKMTFTERFVYRREKKTSVVGYGDATDDAGRILVFCDRNEAEASAREKPEETADVPGLTVLQTTLFDKSPQEIYELYHKRRESGGAFDSLQTAAGLEALHLPDGCQMQGLAFIMLMEALICHEFGEAMKEANLKGKTIRDCLLDARMLKINKRRDAWQICNCRKNVLTLFEQLHTPLTVDAVHT